MMLSDLLSKWLTFGDHHLQLPDVPCSWSMAELEEMATGLSPSVAAYWRNFILYSVASEMEMRLHEEACTHAR